MFQGNWMIEKLRLVILPGLDGTGTLFEEFKRYLPRWIVPEIIPYPTHQPLGYDELVGLVLERMPVTDRYALLGESFSGPVALCVAERAAKPPDAIVLTTSFVTSPVAPPLRLLRPLVNSLLFRLPLPRFAVRAALLDNSVSDELVRKVHLAIRSVDPAVMASRVRTLMRLDMQEVLHQSHLPLLHLVASHDRVVPARMLRQMRLLRPDIVEVSFDAPHLLLQCRPAEAAESVGAFLGSVLHHADQDISF